MAHIALSFLGTFQVTLDGQPVTRFRSANVQGLLAYLALQADRPFPRDVLAALFWPDEPDDVARANLRQTLYQLRKVLGDNGARKQPVLLVDRQTAQFNPRCDHSLDARRFLEAVAGGDLAPAGELYHGDLLPGFACDSPDFVEWLRQERERLHRLAVEAMTALAQRQTHAGDYAAAERTARRLVDLEPWDEQAHTLLMRLLAWQGRRGAALKQYDTLRDSLWEEIGVAPAPAVSELRDRIEAASATRPGNVRRPQTTFFGRQTELAHLSAYLADPDKRLITLLGPGGSGKTRLALEIGHRVATDSLGPFLDGVFLLEVEEDGANFLTYDLADLLAVRLVGDDPERTLHHALRRRELLLILDNFELAGPAGVAWVRRLLHAAPGVKLLVTSRQRLNLTGEWTIAVSGLPLPAGDDLSPTHAAALQLFAERAQRVALDYDFATAPPAEQTAAIRICQMVDGLPLALELAASWVRVLSCTDLAEDIARNLDALTTMQADVPERHRSIRAVFAHSWQRLDATARHALAQLSVLHGPFPRAAATAIAGAAPMTLATLVDHSLLQVEADGRYRLHPLLRQFAAEKLAADPAAEQAARARHAGYFAERVTEAGHLPFTAQTAQIVADDDNLRAAWHWLVAQGEWDTLQAYVSPLFNTYAARGWAQAGRALFTDAEERLAATGTLAEAEEALRAQLQLRAGAFCYTQSDLAQAQRLFQSSLAVNRRLEDPAELYFNYDMLGMVLLRRGEHKAAESHLQFAAQIAREEASDVADLGHILLMLGRAVAAQGRHEEAARLLHESAARYRAAEDGWGEAYVHYHQGVSALDAQAYDEARASFARAETLFSGQHNRQGLAALRFEQGRLAQAESRPGVAVAAFRESAALFADVPDPHGQAKVLSALAGMQCAEQPAQATETWRAALQLALDVRTAPLLLHVVADLVAHTRPGNAHQLLPLLYHHRAADAALQQRVRAIAAEQDVALATTLPDTSALPFALLQQYVAQFLADPP